MAIADFPPRIVTINGRKFVSGLYWQALSKPRSYMDEARKIGKEMGMDVVAIRKGTQLLGGFVSKKAGALKGMYSLAASLAGIVGDSWIGAFKINQHQYAFVAVYGGDILPGSDVIGSHEQILNKCKQAFQDYGDSVGRLIAPEDFKWGNEELDINELLKPNALNKSYRLKPLTFGLSKDEITKLSIGVVAIGLGLFGYSHYKSYQENKKKEAILRLAKIRAQQIKTMNASAAVKGQLAGNNHPWATMPYASDFVTACMQPLDDEPLSIAGWQVSGVTCDGKQLVTTYARKTGTMQTILSAFGNRSLAFTDDDTATITVPVNPVIRGDEGLLPDQTARVDFVSHFQAINQQVKLSANNPAPVAPKLPGQVPAAKPLPVAPQWKVYRFSLDSQQSPVGLFTGLQPSGLRLTKLVMSFKGADSVSWNIAGELYAK